MVDFQPKLAHFQEIKVYVEESMLEMGRNALPHGNDKPIPLLLVGIAISYHMVSSIQLVCDFILTQINSNSSKNSLFNAQIYMTLPWQSWKIKSISSHTVAAKTSKFQPQWKTHMHVHRHEQTTLPPPPSTLMFTLMSHANHCAKGGVL